MSQITKRALEQSLKNLLLQKPLTKITVSDITDDCGVNRMTFYYHFKDIYDLIEWSCLEDAKRALEQNKTYDTWQQGFLQIFYAVRENKPFIINVYQCVDRAQVEKYLKPLTDNLLMGVIEEVCWIGSKTACKKSRRSLSKNLRWLSRMLLRMRCTASAFSFYQIFPFDKKIYNIYTSDKKIIRRLWLSIGILLKTSIL